MIPIRKNFIAIILLLFVLGANHAMAQWQGEYQCPMKCEGEKVYDRPGKCPVCEMDLVEVQSCNSVTVENKPTTNGCVRIAGAMRNVMQKGELNGTIALDTILNKEHLYGIGPLENLKGEILINDGEAFISKVYSDGKTVVTNTFDVKAPFFVYANVSSWKEMSVPDSIVSLKQLEGYLDAVTKYNTRPFCFRVKAITTADIHIVNLPSNRAVTSPKDAHINQKEINIQSTPSELIGFFSTEHAGVFTHHDSYVHVHLITSDKTKMGHCDAAVFKKGTMKLFLPD
jgi:acetolactate decarboxylase